MSLIAGNLAVVQRLLDQDGLPWCVIAGAAAHLYGNRRPIQDVDLLVPKGKLNVVVQMLQGTGKAVQFDGHRILWRGIKFFDDLSIRRAGRTHVLVLDQAMQLRIRRLSLLGAMVAVASPEDVAAHKLLLARGPAEGKHDHEDVAGIVKRQCLDHAYLLERARLLNAEAQLRTQFAEFGMTI